MDANEDHVVAGRILVRIIDPIIPGGPDLYIYQDDFNNAPNIDNENNNDLGNNNNGDNIQQPPNGNNLLQPNNANIMQQQNNVRRILRRRKRVLAPAKGTIHCMVTRNYRSEHYNLRRIHGQIQKKTTI